MWSQNGIRNLSYGESSKYAAILFIYLKKKNCNTFCPGLEMVSPAGETSRSVPTILTLSQFCYYMTGMVETHIFYLPFTIYQTLFVFFSSIRENKLGLNHR